jgi:protein involved in sex pheromone biosynthesis
MSTTDTEVINAFATGSVFSASDDRLQKLLNVLCQTQYHNELIRHRALIYGIAIGQLLMKNYLRHLDRQNCILTGVVIVLALASICAQIFQVFHR